ncbi:hypothetical protein AgCh_035402 [Apium graveolens]
MIVLLCFDVGMFDGVPQIIISDRDPIFLSLFWKELLTALRTHVKPSIAYHLQTEGQTERVNQCIEMFLRCMAGHKPGTWATWLSLVEWWYNTSYHSALDMSPFQALYSTRPPSLNFSYHRTKDAEVNKFLRDKKATQQLIKDNLLKALERIKWYSDKKRTDMSFVINDMMYLKLQPYHQQSVDERKNHKLSAKFYGPFKVLEKIGQVAYKLDLPSEARIHNIFHVSQLKKKIGSNKDVQTTLPTVADTGTVHPQPIAVLERKLIKKGNIPVVMILVQWENGTPQEATWERHDELLKLFPNFDPRGQGSSDEGGKKIVEKEEIGERKKKLKTKKQKSAGHGGKGNEDHDHHEHRPEVIVDNVFALLDNQQSKESSTIIELKNAEVKKIIEQKKKITEINKKVAQEKKRAEAKKKQKKSFVIDDEKSLDSFIVDQRYIDHERNRHSDSENNTGNEQTTQEHKTVNHHCNENQAKNSVTAMVLTKEELCEQFLAKEKARKNEEVTHKEQWLAREAERQERKEQWLARDAECKECQERLLVREVKRN